MHRLLLLGLCLRAFAQTPVFLESLDKIDTNRAEVSQDLKTYRVVDGAKYLPWLENTSAKRALQLYAQAFLILNANGGNPQHQPSDYYIALVKGGNHAAVGFRIKTDT